jgi:branched-chain amino acid transport system permease protein
MYFGALLILAMIFRPQGLVPSRRRLREFDDEEAGLGSADAMGTAAEGPLS